MSDSHLLLHPAVDKLRREWENNLDDFLVYKGQSSAKSTARFYEQQLVLLLRWSVEHQIEFENFRGRDLARYIDWRSKQYSKSRPDDLISKCTLQHDANCAKVFFKWAKQQDLLPRDPLADYRVTKPSGRKAGCPTEDQARALLESFDTRYDARKNPGAKYLSLEARKFHRTRNKAIVTGLFDTGCRIGEMLALKVKDYDPEGLTVTFRDTKTGGDRTAVISRAWTETVDEYLRFRPRNSRADSLFVSEFGEEMNTSGWSQGFRDHQQWCNEHNIPLKGFTLHGIRHYVTTRLVAVNLLGAMKQLGHKDMRTTQGYAHEDISHARDAAVRADVLSSVIVNNRSEKNKRRKLI